MARVRINIVDSLHSLKITIIVQKVREIKEEITVIYRGLLPACCRQASLRSSQCQYYIETNTEQPKYIN